MDTELVLDGSTVDTVRLPGAAIRPRQELRYHKEAYALGTPCSIRQPSQHKVHDIVSQVVLTVGDEDLRALDPVGIVTIRRRRRRENAYVRAGMGLSQAHGPGPLAADELGQVRPLLRIRAMLLKHVHRPHA